MLVTLAARGRETGLIDLRLVQLSAGERETLDVLPTDVVNAADWGSPSE